MCCITIILFIDKHAPMPPADDVDPSLLESLEDSTSSSDIPKSKLDKVRAAYFFGLSDKIAKINVM